MSIPLLVYYVLAKMMLATDSVPLGNGILDPVIFSVESFDGDALPNGRAFSIFRRSLNPEEKINTEKYEGYIFNKNKCIQFNNRILCGYDKNKGIQLDDYTMLDIGNGCRQRGDRIECGYENPVRVYANLRHPDLKHDKHGKHSTHGEHSEHSKHREPSKHGEHSEHGGYHKHGKNHKHSEDTEHIKHTEHGEKIKHEDYTEHGENIKHGEHSKHEEHSEHKEQRKLGDHSEREGNHHNGDQQLISLAGEAPTQAAVTSNPTFQPVMLNGFESNNLGSTLLKSTIEVLVPRAEEKSKRSETMTADVTNPNNSATEIVTLLTVTAAHPIRRKLIEHKLIKRKPTRTPQRRIFEATKTTPIKEIPSKLVARSESNDISDDIRIKRIVKLKPVKRRRLMKTYSVYPKRRSNPKSETTVTQIISPCESRSNDALKEAKRTEEKVKTTCVEKDDRIVCYDFTT